jgi:hypothetical protein
MNNAVRSRARATPETSPSSLSARTNKRGMALLRDPRVQAARWA